MSTLIHLKRTWSHPVLWQNHMNPSFTFIYN
jgi:hypothetical protein